MTQSPPPLNYEPPKAWDKKPLSLTAVFSVISALLLPVIPFLSGLVAVLLAVMGLKQTRTGDHRGRAAAKWGLGLGIANVVIGPLLIVGAIIGIQRARDRSLDVQSMAKLRQLAVAVMMYGNEHRGYYPQSLEQLPKYTGGTGFFVSARGTPGKPAVQLKTFGSDFIYAPPAERMNRVKQPGQVPIAYEPPRHFGGSVRAPVLFADGHVEMLRPPQLYPMLQIIDTNAANATPASAP